MDTDVLSDYAVRNCIRSALLRRDEGRLAAAMALVGDDGLATIVVVEELERVDWATSQFWSQHSIPQTSMTDDDPAGAYSLYKDRLGISTPAHEVRFYGHPIVLVAFTTEDDGFQTKPMCIEHGPVCPIGRFVARRWLEEHGVN